MTFYNESLMNHLADILNLPIPARCTQLCLLFDRCDIRELTEVFPALVESIFGVYSNDIGWGLRTTTKENANQSFAALYDFLDPLGPMFRLCYRLLNDSVKYEFNLEWLPRKMIGLMQTGNSGLFYADLLGVDCFHIRGAYLSLNAFDYYMLHFTRYAILPLHRQSPIALQVHNELLKSVYFFLTASYLNAFLPGDPEAPILPTNICSKVKAPQPLPVQPLQQKKTPKYLKVPKNLLYTPGNSPPQLGNSSCVISPIDCSNDSPKSNYWRTESVLNFFIDTWIRQDIEELRDLPSTDFIRVTRILVKQVHCFGNSAYMDKTPMSSIRKLAQIKLKHRIYRFLKSLISRWPLDDSLAVVLELWFSYIQPWRYSFEIINNSVPGVEIAIHSRYDTFIEENLPHYTQIFIDMMLRLTRLDFTSTSNVNMLYRLARVFNQSALPLKLHEAEHALLLNSMGNDSPQRQSNVLRHQFSQYNSMMSSFNDQEAVPYLELPYVPLFSPEKSFEIQNFLKIITMSRLYILEEMKKLQLEIEKIRKTYSPLKKVMMMLLQEELPLEKQLKQLVKIPYLLENSIKSFSNAFEVELPNVSAAEVENVWHSQEESSIVFQQSNSFHYSGSRRKLNETAERFIKSIDPALMPIQVHECTMLVQILHRLSSLLNRKFGNSFAEFWNRSDFLGRLSRQLLYPPMTTQWFDKPRGIPELFQENLPPRVCLRPLASYRTIAVLGIALVIGEFMASSSLAGLLYFFAFFCIYILIMAFVNN